jgi:hypothetical protein
MVGAKILRHGRYVIFQMAEVAVPRDLFADILWRIDRTQTGTDLHGESRLGPQLRSDAPRATNVSNRGEPSGESGLNRAVSPSLDGPALAAGLFNAEPSFGFALGLWREYIGPTDLGNKSITEESRAISTRGRKCHA